METIIAFDYTNWRLLV